MTKLTLNFGMLLAAAIVAPAYAQDAPTLTPRLHFNLPAGPMENVKSASASIKRMQAAEADAPADSRRLPYTAGSARKENRPRKVRL